jgi:hypothetical protein
VWLSKTVPVHSLLYFFFIVNKVFTGNLWMIITLEVGYVDANNDVLPPLSVTAYAVPAPPEGEPGVSANLRLYF